MAPLWHIGLAAPDLQQAMKEVGDAFMVAWRPIHEAEAKITDEHGKEHALHVTFTFSEGGPFSIEMWQSLPGTPMAQTGDSWMHHIGYWVEDLEAEGERLEAHGWPCFMKAHSVKINRGPGGLMLEPCDMYRDRPFLRDLFPPGSKHYGPPDNDDPKFYTLGT